MGTRRTQERNVSVGVSDHAGWAVLMTVSPDGTVIDRRRVELIDAALPPMPHHHEGQKLPVAAAVALVEQVRRSARAGAKASLEALAKALPVRVEALALRACPPLPETVAERLSNYRARNVADWVMYREALAEAAAAQGWRVHWFDARRVQDEAARALGKKDLAPLLKQTGAALGPPWQKDHKLAMAAAIASAL